MTQRPHDLVPRSSLEECAGSARLWHPVPLLAALVLVVNDHWLKGGGLAPGWLCGKLSDVAGLFLAPLVLVGLLDGLAPSGETTRARRELAVVCGIGLVFAAINTLPWAGELYQRLGAHTLDPSDLLALPVLALSWSWMRRARARTRHPWLERAMLVACSLACLATPAPRMARNYPAWRVDQGPGAGVGCASVDAWVSKSGKTGLGVTLELTSDTASACRVDLAGAQLLVGTELVRAEPARRSLLAQPTAYAYLAFVFDNQAAWNAGVRRATLKLEFRHAGRLSERRYALVHELEAYHRDLKAPVPSAVPGGAQHE